MPVDIRHKYLKDSDDVALGKDEACGTWPIVSIHEACGTWPIVSIHEACGTWPIVSIHEACGACSSWY